MGSAMCGECERRKAVVQVLSIVKGDRVRLRFDPPQPVCVGCYARAWSEARANGARLHVVGMPEPVEADEPIVITMGGVSVPVV